MGFVAKKIASNTNLDLRIDKKKTYAMKNSKTSRGRFPELMGQVALVTGSSKGIGKGIAQRLAEEGMKVVLHGIDRDELNDAVDTFKAAKAEVSGIQADFTQGEAIERLFKDIAKHFGRLDLLVNNAADLRHLPFLQTTPQLLDYQLALNVRAPYLAAWYAAKMMAEQGGGNIIHISSVGAIQAHEMGLPYDMTKGAIDAMTRAMAIDLARLNIRVNAIAPGPIYTEKTPPLDHPEMQALVNRVPIPRFGTPDEIGAAVAFLASPDAAYITGQILVVDGGTTAQISPPGQPI